MMESDLEAAISLPESPPMMVKGNQSKSVSLIMSSSRWDIITLFILIVITGFLENSFSPRVSEANLDDPALNLSRLPEIVSGKLLLSLSMAVPIVGLILSNIAILSKTASLTAVFIIGLFETNVITVVFTNIFKLLVGRPRPYFAAVCESYAPHVSNLCTGDASAVREARKSFPSGHSSLSFSAAIYLTLYLATRLRITSGHTQGKTAKMLLILTPTLGAGFIAVSRLIDHHHHFSDIIAGSLLGTGVAMFVFNVRSQTISKALEGAIGDNVYQPILNDDAV